MSHLEIECSNFIKRLLVRLNKFESSQTFNNDAGISGCGIQLALKCAPYKNLIC